MVGGNGCGVYRAFCVTAEGRLCHAYTCLAGGRALARDLIGNFRQQVTEEAKNKCKEIMLEDKVLWWVGRS